MWWEAVDSPRVQRFGRGEITVVFPSPDSLGWGPDSQDTPLTDEPQALSLRLLTGRRQPSLSSSSLLHSSARPSATCQAWAASNGPLPTQSQAVITRHAATDGWAGADMSDPLGGGRFFTFVIVYLYVCECVGARVGACVCIRTSNMSKYCFFV